MKTIRLKDGFVVTPKSVERIDIILRNGMLELDADGDDCDEVVE